jgi:hypothetical protein
VAEVELVGAAVGAGVLLAVTEDVVGEGLGVGELPAARAPAGAASWMTIANKVAQAHARAMLLYSICPCRNVASQVVPRLLSIVPLLPKSRFWFSRSKFGIGFMR